MRVITGVAGFLGFHLAVRLLKEGHSVLGVDNFYTGSRKNVADLQASFPAFSFLERNIVEICSPDFFCDHIPQNESIDRIYHLACPASPPAYQMDPLFTLDTCYLGSRAMLAAAERFGARILLASTSEVYGDPAVHPQPESYWGNVNSHGPRACYDEGKRVMEALAFAYRQRGTAIRIARIFNTYGPRMSPFDGRVLTNFIMQALRGEELTVYGDGSQTRSFCYVDDLVDGLCRLMESSTEEPVNLGSSFEYSILEIAHAVRRIAGPGAGIVFQPLPQDDPKIRRPDTTKAQTLLGWQAGTSLETGVSLMVKAMGEGLVNGLSAELSAAPAH